MAGNLCLSMKDGSHEVCEGCGCWLQDTAVKANRVGDLDSVDDHAPESSSPTGSAKVLVSQELTIEDVLVKGLGCPPESCLVVHDPDPAFPVLDDEVCSLGIQLLLRAKQRSEFFLDFQDFPVPLILGTEVLFVFQVSVGHRANPGIPEGGLLTLGQCNVLHSSDGLEPFLGVQALLGTLESLVVMSQRNMQEAPPNQGSGERKLIQFSRSGESVKAKTSECVLDSVRATLGGSRVKKTRQGVHPGGRSNRRPCSQVPTTACPPERPPEV